MLSLFNIYKKLIICILGLGFCLSINSVIAAEDSTMTEQEVMESDIEAEHSFNSNTAYISDIEILGANIIKPEFILKKMSLQRGDLYDKDAMQQDLKTIYKLGYFTERMKAIPVKTVSYTHLTLPTISHV